MGMLAMGKFNETPIIKSVIFVFKYRIVLCPKSWLFFFHFAYKIFEYVDNGKIQWNSYFKACCFRFQIPHPGHGNRPARSPQAS